MPLLQIDNLSVDFVSENHTAQAVKALSLHVDKSEILALVGESGSGKSVTSLSILQLLPKPPAQYKSGQILFSQKDQTIDLLKADAATLRRLSGASIAMIFQEPMTAMNPLMTCGSQVAEVLLTHKKISAKEARRITIDWFAKVKLPQPEEMYNRYPHQLSGGQKQRVMIAMAMCCSPSLLICDEPTTALDVTVQQAILQLIRDLQQEQDMGVIFITHDLGVVAQIADRVAIMYKGEIVETGSTQAIFTAAQHPYTKALIACRPALHPKGDRLPTVAHFLSAENEATPQSMPSVNTIEDKVIMDVQNLVVQFPVKTSFFGKTTVSFTAVDEVSLQVFKGETLGLVGESGCGKTTLGRTLLHLVEPSAGRILYNGKDVTRLTNNETKLLRKEVQLVFQDPFSSLNPRLTIGAAIAEPMQVGGMAYSKKDRKEKVARLLSKVDMPSTAMNRYPHQFSGGQRQRIVIARALALDPQFLVCDESVSALDVSVQAQVLNLLNDLKRELQLTLLFISHDLSVVRYMCDRIMVMKGGKIVESGAADEVYNHPQTAYTKSLLAAIPNL